MAATQLTVIRGFVGDFFIRERETTGNYFESKFWDLGWHCGVMSIYSSATGETVDCPKNWVLV